MVSLTITTTFEGVLDAHMTGVHLSLKGPIPKSLVEKWILWRLCVGAASACALAALGILAADVQPVVEGSLDSNGLIYTQRSRQSPWSGVVGHVYASLLDPIHIKRRLIQEDWWQPREIPAFSLSREMATPLLASFKKD